MNDIPRLVPETPLPPYSYIPGRNPHPHSDPTGHSYGKEPEAVEPPDPDKWQSCRPYLYGIDLFNHGYYWEAHEAWESLWHAAGRKGTTAAFLKGLIKLAAAGVKMRENIPNGVRSHARRAKELIAEVSDQCRGEWQFMGLNVIELMRIAEELAGKTDEEFANSTCDLIHVKLLVLK